MSTMTKKEEKSIVQSSATTTTTLQDLNEGSDTDTEEIILKAPEATQSVSERETAGSQPPRQDSVSSFGRNRQPHVYVANHSGSASYGPFSQDVNCPFCHHYGRTLTLHMPSTRTHLIAVLLCVLQLYCFLWVPYCCGTCMNTNHYCSHCGEYLGQYVR